MTVGYLPFGAGDEFISLLRKAGCERVIVGPENNADSALLGVASGLAKTDTLVICRLDHIGTSIDLIRLAAALGKQKAHVKILLEDIDTLRDTGRYEMRSSH